MELPCLCDGVVISLSPIISHAFNNEPSFGQGPLPLDLVHAWNAEQNSTNIPHGRATPVIGDCTYAPLKGAVEQVAKCRHMHHLRDGAGKAIRTHEDVAIVGDKKAGLEHSFRRPSALNNYLQ